MRVVTGFGEAGFFVGAATMITDLAPVGPARRSRELLVGRGVRRACRSVRCSARCCGTATATTLTFVVSAALAFVAAILGLFTRRRPTRRTVRPGKRGRSWHPAAVGPGIVLFLGLMPLVGVHAVRAALRPTATCTRRSGWCSWCTASLILVVRIVGARVPDRYRRAARRRGRARRRGLGIADDRRVADASAGLIVGTVVFAVGMSLMYPALLLLALAGVADCERASVVGTFSSFFDLSHGLRRRDRGRRSRRSPAYRGAFAVPGVDVPASVLAVLRRAPAARSPA